jgi:hypothetical protein
MRFTLLGDLLDEPEETTAGLIEGRLPMAAFLCSPASPKAGKRALEEKRAEGHRHFRAMGARGDADVRFFIAPSPEDGLHHLREATERERPVLIVVDPLLRFVRVRDANDYAVVTAALEPLVTLARETGAHVLAVHHEGTLTRDGGDGIFGYRLLRRRGYGPSPAAVREVPNALHDSAIRRRPGGDDPLGPPRDPLGIGWEWAGFVRVPDDCAPRTRGGWQRTTSGGG